MAFFSRATRRLQSRAAARRWRREGPGGRGGGAAQRTREAPHHHPKSHRQRQRSGLRVVILRPPPLSASYTPIEDLLLDLEKGKRDHYVDELELSLPVAAGDDMKFAKMSTMATFCI